MLQRLCARGLCKQINVILWILLLCLMKRYVDVIKCYKKLLIFYKKKKKKKQKNSKPSSCCCSSPPACGCDFLEAGCYPETRGRRPKPVKHFLFFSFFSFSNQSHVPPPPSNPLPSLGNQWPRSLEPPSEYWTRWLSNWWKRREGRP